MQESRRREVQESWRREVQERGAGEQEERGGTVYQSAGLEKLSYPFDRKICCVNIKRAVGWLLGRLEGK